MGCVNANRLVLRVEAASAEAPTGCMLPAADPKLASLVTEK
jgi:hypothetical protein